MSIIKHITHGKPKLILSLFLFLFPFEYILSQNVNITPPVSSNIVHSKIDKLFGADQRLVSGVFYDAVSLGLVNGHPYFFDNKWKNGSVILEGIKYNNLQLKYDVASNTIVLRTLNLDNNVIQLGLKKEKISEFSMGSAKFIRFSDKNRNSEIIFAQLCAEGNVDFLHVRKKELVLSEGGSTDFKYKEYYQNYLRYNGNVIKFKNKKTLYNLFPEFKSALKKYLAHNHLSTGKKDTHNRTMLVNYCNSLLSNSK